MTYQTSTITRTQTVTHTDVRHVLWKVKSDMFQLRIFHNCFTRESEGEMASDLFQWVYRGYAERIKFTFFDPQSSEVLHEINYRIIRGGVVGSDNEAGSIPFLDVSGATFKVFVTTNEAWRSLTDVEKQRFYNSLNLQWGSSNLRLTYSGGSWSRDKSYARNSIAAKRSIYSRLS
ncbi:hypothetical protein KAT60_00070 [Candidatus Woesebacteria bacterium]|nr:hypothetical protein [Candidatus Woesebacteria bacterium]